jgi:hypothetical protein
MLSRLIYNLLKYFQPVIKQRDIFENITLIKEIVKSDRTILNNQLLLSCILSTLVYKYKEPKILNQLTHSQSSRNFKKVAFHCGLHRGEIYNLDNQLVFATFYFGDDLYIAFKGSSEYNDFINDLYLTPTDIGENKLVHSGFYDIIYNNGRIDVLNEIVGESENRVILTGHSLGAGLATIYHNTLKDLGRKTELITFGAPLVGNKHFTKQIESVNVINGSDVITKLPFFYSSIKNKFFIGKKGWWSITDHSILNYFYNLLKS